MENFSISDLLAKGSELAVEYVPKLLLAIITLLAGLWIIRRLVRFMTHTMEKRETDAALRTFLSDLTSVLLKVVLFISVASMVGIQTTSFVAILGAAGLAVGLALQGSLGNFAGGVLILLFRPFKVGDLIDAQGHFGAVEAINIFVTTIITLDNKTVIIPNGPLAGGNIVNVSRKGHLRVDLTIGISYSSNIQQARDVLMKVMESHPKVMKDPAPSVNVSELGDSSINLAVRPYATVEDYWDVYFGITEQSKIALDEAGIEIPFPQRVIHQAKA